MKRLFFIFAIPLLLLIANGLVFGQSVSITSISPESPSRLNFNQKVAVSFDYSIHNSNGVRIFVRPVTVGNLTSNYAASGSRVYKGKGSATVNFTITDKAVTVDQLRVQVWSSNQSRLLFEFFIPVDFTFSKISILHNFPIILNERIVNDLPTINNGVTHENNTTDSTVVPKIIKQIVKEDGTIEIHYSDGTIWGILPFSDQTYRVDPSTGDTTFTRTIMIEVQGTEKPDPPGLMATNTSQVDNQWLSSLNAWLKYFASQQLLSIEMLLDEDSFQNFQTFEQENSSNIYQKINLRYNFLIRLRQ